MPIFSLLIIIMFLLLLPINSSGETESEISPSNNPIRKITDQSTQNHMLPAEVFKRRSENTPLFIFLPGILGSKISYNGDVLWGENISHELTYDPSKQVEVALLEEYDTYITDVDVYGKFFQTVNELTFTDQKHLLIFPYDWRQDNRKSAKLFNDKLKSDEWNEITSKRDVTIVAHSMGGIVTAYWLHKYYSDNKDNYPFNLSNVIYLGTPHRGSVAAFQMLVKGYNTAPKASLTMKVIEKTLFKQLNETAYTFPSVYQLLPTYFEKIDVISEDGRRNRGASLFSIKPWKRFDWLKNTAELNEMTKEQKKNLYDTVEPLLKDGLDFQIELNNLKHNKNPDVNIIYFYSESHATPARIEVHQKGNHYRTEFKQETDGDGRVLKEVAIEEYKKIKSEYCRALVETHGNLPKDNMFLIHISNMIDEASYAFNIKAAKLLLKYPFMSDLFAEKKLLLTFPISNYFTNKQGFLDISKANHMIAENISLKHNINPLETILKRSKKEEKHYFKNMLNSTALTLMMGNRQIHFAAKQMGDQSLAQNQSTLAKSLYKLSIDNLPNDSMIFASEELKDSAGDAYKKMGIALLYEGKKNSAISKFMKAKDFGNKYAAEYLKRNKVEF